MKNLKISLSPPYKPEDGTVAKIEFSADFEDEKKALAFMSQLNRLVLEFNSPPPLMLQEESVGGVSFRPRS